MATAGGTPQVRSCAGFLAIGLVVGGCGDRHLTAILPGPVDHTNVPPDTTPGPDACAAPAGARLPPMGWNGWNAFRCRAELDQTRFLANVDALVASGMKAAGYEYANLDDCWQSARGADGAVTANARFPDGVGALGRYVHARGLKLGIDAHIGECQRPEMTTPASLGYEAADAAAFADWGVDYLKYASCSGTDADDPTSFGTMRAAVDQTRRPMLFGVVAAPFKDWQPSVAQQWRTHGDIEPAWAALLEIIDTNSKLAAYAGQAGFNDADMLWVGFPALSEAESRAHFSMWALMASPILAGNDLSAMSDATAALLTNREVIALDQDGLGLQGVELERQGDVGVYGKPLGSCGARGVVLLNRGEEVADASVSWSALGLAPGRASVRDLWTARDLDAATDTLTLSVPPHDVRALRIVGSEPPLPRGRVFVSDLSWSYAANGFGPVERDQELGGQEAGDGQPLTLGGKRYAKGLGTNSPALVRYRLGKACQTFSAEIGIDDLTGDSGSADFQVWADGEKLFDSGVILGTSPPRHIDVDVTGKDEIRLFVGQVEDYSMDHADWADARLLCAE